MELVWNLYQTRVDRDVIVKDCMKSSKARWLDACCIPAGTNRARFEQIYAVFREDRGENFHKGVVFRDFMDIRRKAPGMKGFPIGEEARLFFWDGRLMCRCPGTTVSPLAALPRWEAVAARFDTVFMTIDVALLVDGRRAIVEVADGGSSGMPKGLACRELGLSA